MSAWAGTNGAREGEFAAIFYDPLKLQPIRSGTLWFSTTPDVPGSRYPGCFHPRICSWAEFRWEGETIRVCNLHLDNESEAARKFATRLLIERFGPDVPSLILGDFNAGESENCIEAMKLAGWRDSFRLIHPFIEAATFHGFGSAPGEKIDFVWIDRNWTVIDAGLDRAQRFGVWPSDHFPVTAVLRL